MEKKTWAKLTIAGLLITAIAAGLYLRWTPLGQSSSPLEHWGKGNLTISEGAYYRSQMNFIIENWQHSRRNAENDSNGRLKDSYKTFFIIDLDEQALWIENNGRIEKETYAKLPAGIKWTLYHFTPQGDTELPGRTILKMRGFNSSRQTPEQFTLIGTGRDSHLCFDFNSSSRGSGHGSGSYNKPSFSFKSSPTNTDGFYGSIIVTQDEYQQYRDSLPDSTSLKTDEGNAQSEIISELGKNKEAWHRVAKSLYIEIDRQVQKAGFELTAIEIEPGPDFSAAHAEIRGFNRSFIRKILGRSPFVEAYLKTDYLGENVWYAASSTHPHRKIPSRQQFNLEFLVSPTIVLSHSKQREYIRKGREIQKSIPIPEAKWKATYPNGTTIEFFGICENPSAGKQWWGPDGSPLDYVPYTNAKPYGRPREDRKIYEFAWRIKSPAGSGATRYTPEGSMGSYRQYSDRYGNNRTEDLYAEGYGFDKSRQKTTFKFGFTAKEWQTALSIKDEADEIKFLDKQRIILNPPKIENGQIVIHCYEQYETRMRDYKTEFGLIVKEGSQTKTVALTRYEIDVTDHRDTGLTEHKFIIEDPDKYQIMGVCFRYRPYEFVKFKNISLVPGQNMGFEIVLGEQ